jgi:hypothetical protein
MPKDSARLRLSLMLSLSLALSALPGYCSAADAAVAVRSNELHTRYRNAKAKVEEAQTAEELEAIKL